MNVRPCQVFGILTNEKGFFPTGGPQDPWKEPATGKSYMICFEDELRKLRHALIDYEMRFRIQKVDPWSNTNNDEG